MWNTHCSNYICSNKDKNREHFRYLEKLLTIRPVLNISEPYKPSFLLHNLVKEEMKDEEEKRINYENSLLKRKILELNIKPGKYNSMTLSPRIYPAFIKRRISHPKKIKEYDDIKESNKRHNLKIANIKSHYDNKVLTQQSRENKKYQKNLSNSKKNRNPYLNLPTPEEVRKLENLFVHEYFMEMQRPKSAKVSYSTRKTNSTTFNSIQTRQSGTLANTAAPTTFNYF